MSYYTSYYNKSNPSDKTSYNFSGLDKSEYATSYTATPVSSGYNYQNYSANPNPGYTQTGFSGGTGPSNLSNTYSNAIQIGMNNAPDAESRDNLDKTFFSPMGGGSSSYLSNNSSPSSTPKQYSSSGSWGSNPAPVVWEAPSYTSSQDTYGANRLSEDTETANSTYNKTVDDFTPSYTPTNTSGMSWAQSYAQNAIDRTKKSTNVDGYSAYVDDKSSALRDKYAAKSNVASAGLLGSTAAYASESSAPTWKPPTPKPTSALPSAPKPKQSQVDKKAERKAAQAAKKEARKAAKGKAQARKKNKGKNKNKNKNKR